MLSDNPNVNLKIFDCSLFTKPNQQYYRWNLEREPAQNNYMNNIARIFIIPSSQKQIIRRKVFNNNSLRKIAVAMKTNSAVAGLFHENSFNYQQIRLRELRNIRDQRAIVSLDTIFPCRPYITTMKAMQFNEDFPSLPSEDFRYHSVFLLDFTTGCS